MDDIASHHIRNIYIPSLFNPLNIELHKKSEAIFEIGNIWIPVIVISLHHKVRFFFPRIDELFIVEDKVVRV